VITLKSKGPYPRDCSSPCEPKLGLAAISVWTTRSPSGSVEVLRIVTNSGVDMITASSLVIVTGIALSRVVSGSTNTVLVDDEVVRAEGATTTTSSSEDKEKVVDGRPRSRSGGSVLGGDEGCGVTRVGEEGGRGEEGAVKIRKIPHAGIASGTHPKLQYS
jgi:hypothetical protein